MAGLLFWDKISGTGSPEQWLTLLTAGLGFESHQSYVGLFSTGGIQIRAGSAMGPMGRLGPHSRASSTSRPANFTDASLRLFSSVLDRYCRCRSTWAWLTPGYNYESKRGLRQGSRRDQKI